MIKHFISNGTIAVLIGFCSFIYGLFFAQAGNYVLSYAEFECTKTLIIGRTPNRTEQCVKYEKKELKNER